MEEWEEKRLEATVATAALCAYVDGHLAEEERKKMCECITRRAATEVEAQQLISFVRRLPEWVDAPESGYRARQYELIKAGLRTMNERKHAFFLAVQVAEAHRGIALQEASFLIDLMHELEIDEAYARRVLLDKSARQSENPPE